jgi:hypothetical protein
MIHSWVSKQSRVYRYYVCVKAHQRGWAQCETRSVSAPVLEEAVLSQLRGLGRDPAVLRSVLGEIEQRRAVEIALLGREQADAEAQIKSAAREMAEVAPQAAHTPSALERLAQLQDHARHLNERLADVRGQLERVDDATTDPATVEAALREFNSLWEQLSTSEQERFIRILVDQVRYDGRTGTVTVGFRSMAARDLCNWAADRSQEGCE